MTERIQEFLRNRRSEGLDTEPCLVVDLEVVRDNYQTFAKALPDSRVFYAVKANPATEVLQLLASMGSCFDTATVAEIEMALAAGATPDRISYGNTIKKERDIARAFALGIRLYAVDCKAEVEKIARAAPGSKVFCRFLHDCAGAEWPLSRKFGCDPAMAVEVLEHAHRLGLVATMEQSIRYPIRTPRDGDDLGACVIAGPTCDSMDVLYEKEPYMLPVSLEIGDKVLIEGTGAYTTTYSSVAFNGFTPLQTF